jgi:FkbM family methyltransferase
MSNTKNLLFIGANDMHEIENYATLYDTGLFIEALPDVFMRLKQNLDRVNNKYNINFKAINALVSNKEGIQYTFNIFSNGGASSSIYEPNSSCWQWPHVTKTDTITLTSTTVETILQNENWQNKTYDMVLDVQGAELDVLNGFGEDNIKNIQRFTTEISTEPFYVGGVIFKDLDNFITSRGFKLISAPTENHCDVVYIPV